MTSEERRTIEEALSRLPQEVYATAGWYCDPRKVAHVGLVGQFVEPFGMYVGLRPHDEVTVQLATDIATIINGCRKLLAVLADAEQQMEAKTISRTETEGSQDVSSLTKKG